MTMHGFRLLIDSLENNQVLKITCLSLKKTYLCFIYEDTDLIEDLRTGNMQDKSKSEISSKTSNNRTFRSLRLSAILT